MNWARRAIKVLIVLAMLVAALAWAVALAEPSARTKETVAPVTTPCSHGDAATWSDPGANPFETRRRS